MNIKQLRTTLGTIKRLFYDSRPQKLGKYGKNVYIEYPLVFHNYNPQIEMFARFKMKSSFHKTKRII